MKLKYRFLFPALIAAACALTGFGSLLLRDSFRAQLERERFLLGEGMRARAYALQAAYANYALQGIDINQEALNALARAQDENARLALSPGAFPGQTVLRGETLWAEIAVPLGDRWYRLESARDLSDLYTRRARQTGYFRAAYLGAILALSAVILAISARVTRPLCALSRASDALSRGDLKRRASADAGGEIGALARAFNAMADALSDQIQSQARLIEDLTHEMKTPLAAIVGHAERIRALSPGAEEALLAAQTIVREGKRLSALSGALTDLILLKRDAPAFRPLCASLLFEDTLRAFAPLPGGAGVTIARDVQNARLLGDRALLESVLSNLVKNALNAGAAHVILRCEFLPPNRARVRVEDDGCGMDARALAHIAEPFYRVDKARSRENGGAGLGLALCDAIIRLHGGALRFESAPGRGTTAIFEVFGKKALNHGQTCGHVRAAGAGNPGGSLPAGRLVCAAGRKLRARAAGNLRGGRRLRIRRHA